MRAQSVDDSIARYKKVMVRSPTEHHQLIYSPPLTLMVSPVI